MPADCLSLPFCWTLLVLSSLCFSLSRHRRPPRWLEGWRTEEDETAGSFFRRGGVENPVNPTSEAAGRKTVTPSFLSFHPTSFLLLCISPFSLLSVWLSLFLPLSADMTLCLFLSLLTSSAEEKVSQKGLIFLLCSFLFLSSLFHVKVYREIRSEWLPPPLPSLLFVGISGDTASCSFSATDPC